MPIALINLGGNADPLSLMYSLTHTIDRSSMGDGWKGMHVHKLAGPKVSYVLRPTERGKPKKYEESLWITGSQMAMTARISNEGATGALLGWTAGFVQSIHSCSRIGHYEDRTQRMLRLNTSLGPLKDGGENSIFYTDAEEAIEGDSVTVELDDSPNFEVPLRQGPNQARLVATSGADVFSSHLVLVRGKTIIRLAQVNWTIDWTGEVSWGQPKKPERPGAESPQTSRRTGNSLDEIVWTPHSVNDFMRSAAEQNAELYADLNVNNAHTPFSLDLNEAECYCELYVKDDWRRCSIGGNLEGGQNLSPRSWRKT